LDRPVDAERIHSRLFNLGLLMNVFAPVAIIFIGALLKAKGVGISGNTDLTVFFWVLLAVAVSEIPAIYLVKKILLNVRRIDQAGCSPAALGRALMQWGLITFSLALAPSFYGLVYYFLGGNLERFVLFAAITLFCFLVFKPKEEQISSFVRDGLNLERPAGGV
jgi:cbb3-type cytochrome oxidase subunit 1